MRTQNTSCLPQGQVMWPELPSWRSSGRTWLPPSRPSSPPPLPPPQPPSCPLFLAAPSPFPAGGSTPSQRDTTPERESVGGREREREEVEEEVEEEKVVSCDKRNWFVSLTEDVCMNSYIFFRQTAFTHTTLTHTHNIRRAHTHTHIFSTLIGFFLLINEKFLNDQMSILSELPLNALKNSNCNQIETLWQQTKTAFNLFVCEQ